MDIEIDHFMTIGKGHQVCEDYIISGLDPFPYVILADGCSSSEHTDIGARVLSHVARKNLEYMPHYFSIKNFGETVIHDSTCITTELDLPISSLDATLIVAWLEDGLFHVFVYGDGYVILQSKQHSFIHKTEYEYNAPYYLSYKADERRRKDYNNRFPDGKRIYTRHGFGFIHNVSFNSVDSYLHLKLNAEYYDSIFISSDGLDSFDIPDTQIINEFLNFKNIKGAFIQRRVKRAIKEFEKQGHHHFDDISIGGILCKSL